MERVAKHPSLWWLETTAPPPFPVLRGDREVDVCIVGGGITGLTAARLLERAGKTVAVVEAHRCGGGETGHTTAHVSTHHDLPYRETIERFGEDDARLILSSRRAAIAQLETFVVEDEISCHWQRVPAYLFAEDSAGLRALQAEMDACARLGLDVEWTEELPARVSILGAVRFANQAQLHPLEYLRALAASIPRNGSHLFEHTRVLDVREGAPCAVLTDRGTIRCTDVVVATNAPLVGQLLVTKIAAYRTYAMAFRIEAAAAPDALLWDSADPYHYVRVQRARGVSHLVVGGEDHKTGHREDADPESAWRRLEAWTRARFVAGEVVARWSGQILEPVDGLPYIGREKGHVWVATGYAGDGITNGTLAGMLLSQELLGEHSPIAKIYAPTRLRSMASREFVRENVDYPVHLLTDRLRRPEGDRLRVVGPGEGKIVRVGGEKLAVFRESGGAVHAFSPICPHMGCHVQWNAAESSWDCPCHGSRFDAASGEVLDGPAAKGLAARDVSERASAVPPLRPSVAGIHRPSEV